VSQLRAAADRLSPHESPRRRWAATAVSLLVVVGLTLLDASWSEVISATVVVAPFLAAMFAGVRQTGVVAAAAVASALLSGIWNDNFGDAGYVVRTAIVVIGGIFSVLAARTRGEATRAEALGEQLTAALSNLAEAVVVQDREQRLVYANEAAAATLGFPSVDALLGAAPADLVEIADFYNEDGSPLTPEQYPSYRVLRGEEVPPQRLRVINRETGEERWRVNKARGVLDARGEPRLVVTVIEDITE
jgi:PAS domain S-box-containing protein